MAMVKLFTERGYVSDEGQELIRKTIHPAMKIIFDQYEMSPIEIAALVLRSLNSWTQDAVSQDIAHRVAPVPEPVIDTGE